MNEHDSIILTETLYSFDFGVIPQGTSGCIVHVYNADNFEVELFNPKKETIGVLTLNAKQIQQI